MYFLKVQFLGFNFKEFVEFSCGKKSEFDVEEHTKIIIPTCTIRSTEECKQFRVLSNN